MGYLSGVLHILTSYSLGVLLDYPSGVLYILTAPLGCFWTTSQGMLIGYTLLLDYLSGVLHLPTNYTHGVLLARLPQACSLARPLGAVGLSLRGCCTCSLATPLGCCWITSEGCCTCSLHLGVLLGYLKCCLLYTSPSPRDATLSRMPSSA